jgi:hypothetical protein
MRQCQPAQDRAAGRSQLNKNLALVFHARNSRDRPRGLKPVHQLDGAVVLDKQPSRNFPDGGLHSLGKAMDHEQQLMLMRLDPMLLCRGLAEMQELPDLPTELGQIVILVGEKVAVGCHIYIVTRYK